MYVYIYISGDSEITGVNVYIYIFLVTVRSRVLMYIYIFLVTVRSRVLMAFTGEEGDDDWCVEYRPVLPPVDGDDRNTEWHTVQKSVHPAAEELMPTVNASRSLSDDAGEGRSIAMITIAMPENVTSTGDAMTAVVHPDSMFGLTSFQQQAADRTALVGSV